MSTAGWGAKGARRCEARQPRGSRGTGVYGKRRKRWRAAFDPAARPSPVAAVSAGRSRPGPPPGRVRGATDVWGWGGPAVPGDEALAASGPSGRAVARTTFPGVPRAAAPPRGRVPPGCGAGPWRRRDSPSRRASRPLRRVVCRDLQVGGRGPVGGGAEGGLRVPASPGRRLALGLPGTGLRGGRGGGRGGGRAAERSSRRAARAAPPAAEPGSVPLCAGERPPSPPFVCGQGGPSFPPCLPPSAPPAVSSARRRPGPARSRAVTPWAAAAPAGGAAPRLRSAASILGRPAASPESPRRCASQPCQIPLRNTRGALHPSDRTRSSLTVPFSFYFSFSSGLLLKCTKMTADIFFEFLFLKISECRGRSGEYQSAISAVSIVCSVQEVARGAPHTSRILRWPRLFPSDIWWLRCACVLKIQCFVFIRFGRA